MTQYHQGGVLSGSFSTLDNIIARDFGALTEDYDGNGYWLRGSDNSLRNSILVDAGGQGITLVGERHLVEFCKVYGTPNADANGTNFFVLMSGTTAPVRDNVVRNTYIERDLGAEVEGNGFSVKGWGTGNLFENNCAVAMRGGAFNAQHSRVTNNTYRNNTIIGGDGVSVRAGANNNVFEGFTIRGSRYAVTFNDAGEDPLNEGVGGEANLFRSFILEDITEALFFFVGYDGRETTESRDNVFEDMQHSGVTPWLFWGDHYSVRTVFRDSDFAAIEDFALSRYLDLTDLEVRFENSTCAACESALP